MGLADFFGDGFLGEIASSITATQAVTITSVQAETPDDATSPSERRAATGEVTARATVADAATTLSGIRMSRGREKERERERERQMHENQASKVYSLHNQSTV